MSDERPKRRPAGRRRLDSGSAYQIVDDSAGFLSREALTHTEEVPLPAEPVEPPPEETGKEDRLVRILMGLAIAIALWTTAFLYSQPPPAAPVAPSVAPVVAPTQPTAPARNGFEEIDGVRVKASISNGLYEDAAPAPTGTAPAMDTPPTM